jgi:hypothetical protein
MPTDVKRHDSETPLSLWLRISLPIIPNGVTTTSPLRSVNPNGESKAIPAIRNVKVESFAEA